MAIIYTDYTVPYTSPPLANLPTSGLLTDYYTMVRSFKEEDTSPTKGVMYFPGSNAVTPDETSESVQAVVNAGYEYHFHAYHGMDGATAGAPFGLSVGHSNHRSMQRWHLMRALYVDGAIATVQNQRPAQQLVIAGQSNGALSLAAYLTNDIAYVRSRSAGVITRAKGFLLNGLVIPREGAGRWNSFGASLSGVAPLVTGLPDAGPRIAITWGGDDQYVTNEIIRTWLRTMNSPVIHPYCPFPTGVHAWHATTGGRPEWVRLMGLLHDDAPLTDMNGDPIPSCADLNKGYYPT
jgi:hypothetical protein